MFLPDHLLKGLSAFPVFSFQKLLLNYVLFALLVEVVVPVDFLLELPDQKDWLLVLVRVDWSGLDMGAPWKFIVSLTLFLAEVFVLTLAHYIMYYPFYLPTYQILPVFLSQRPFSLPSINPPHLYQVLLSLVLVTEPFP